MKKEDKTIMYELSHAEQAETGLFFRLDGEAAERHGAICGMQIDFERDFYGYLSLRFDCQRHLKTPAFKSDLKRVLDYLRKGTETPPLGNIQNFTAFCREHEGQTLTNGGINVPYAFGVKAQTKGYTYCFRCQPGVHNVNIFAYDNRYLLPELAGQHKLPADCYSVLPSNGELILIVKGKNGYYPCSTSTPFPDINRKFADENNAQHGVTRAQEEAMIAGSLFGWNVPGAKPWKYNLDGTPRPAPPKRTEPDR